MRLHTRVPPLALAGSAAVAQHLLARASTPRTKLRLAAAGGLAAASAALLGSSVMEFRRNRTSVNPMSPDVATALVTAGPHRLTRNPMYVGMAGLLAAHTVARGRLIAVVPVVGFVVATDRCRSRRRRPPGWHGFPMTTTPTTPTFGRFPGGWA